MLGLGLTRRQIQWMVTSGELVRMFHGVYRPASVPPSVELRVRAGVLARG